MTSGSPGTAASACTRSRPWPGDPKKLLVAISAVGVWLTEDGGETWRIANDGIVPRYLPEEARAEATMNHCVHDVRRAPSRPERLFMQFHDGVYRSDDGGATWLDIGTDTGLPSDFGFPIVVDPADPDSAFVIPLVGAEDRTMPAGSVKVWETRDAGASWAPRGDGLPEQQRIPHRAPRGVRLGGRGQRASSSTSARRRATCSARPTAARPGTRSRSTSRRSTACARP